MTRVVQFRPRAPDPPGRVGELAAHGALTVRAAVVHAEAPADDRVARAGREALRALDVYLAELNRALGDGAA